MKKEKLIAGGLVTAALVFAVAEYFLFPEWVAVQKNFNGEVSNWMPKYLAIPIPFLVTALSACAYYFLKQASKKKYLFLACIGLVMSVLTIIFNL